jgi:peptidyl-prolyl cis-trans isomerase SurA
MKNLFLISCALIVFITGCSRSKKTLVEIGDEKITLGEFEKNYLKDPKIGGNIDTARNKSTEEKGNYLNLYIRFRLKVKDARERGLLNDPDIQKEVNEYKKTFSPTFLVDKEVVEQEVEKLYERKKDEIRASHILINLAEHPQEQDSIAAYQKADSIIQRLKNGEDFGDLALAYSMDRTVNQNRGDLYYFTGGMTVESFEDAVYGMRVGDFSRKPIRTIFGLHIVKVTDRKPRLEQIRASHILIQDKRDSTGKIIDSVETYQRTLELFERAKKGEDFGNLAQQVSEDPATKPQGGDLGYFDRRRMTQPFDSVVFALRIGEIAGPVRTQYGWHIIKKTDEKPYLPYDKQKENLKNEYKRTRKYKDDYAKYVERLKQEYNFKISDDGLNFVRGKFDSTKTIADYNLDSLFGAEDRNKIIAAFDGGTIIVSDLLNHLNTNRDFQRTPLIYSTLVSVINSAAESPILNKRAKDMKIEKDEEYIATLQEYENGLLVFRIDQDELWKKVNLSEAELMNYYTANKSKWTKLDSLGQQVEETYEEARAKVSSELQQVRFKEIENEYIESLKQKYPVIIHEDVLLEAFRD